MLFHYHIHPAVNKVPRELPTFNRPFKAPKGVFLLFLSSQKHTPPWSDLKKKKIYLIALFKK